MIFLRSCVFCQYCTATFLFHRLSFCLLNVVINCFLLSAIVKRLHDRDLLHLDPILSHFLALIRRFSIFCSQCRLKLRLQRWLLLCVVENFSVRIEVLVGLLLATLAVTAAVEHDVTGLNFKRLLRVLDLAYSLHLACLDEWLLDNTFLRRRF